MRLSLLAQILDLLCPRHCLICGQRLLGEEEIICIACNLHLPRTNTWQQPEDNDMAKLFWHSIPVEKCCAPVSLSRARSCQQPALPAQIQPA